MTSRVAAQISLSWLTAGALAGLYIGLGRQLDRLLDGRGLDQVALIWLAGLGLVAGAAAWAGPVLAAGEQNRIERTERGRVVAQVFALGAGQRSRERTGRIVSTATDGVERVAGFKGGFIGPMAASMTIPLLVLVVVALTIDPLAAAWLALGVPAVPLMVGAFQGVFRSVSQRYRANAQKLSAQFLDAIQGLPTLRLIGAGRRMGQRLADAAERLRRHVMGLLAGNQLVLLIVDSLFSLAFVVLAVGLGLWRLQSGHITAGQALALLLCASLLLDPLDRLGQFFYIGMAGAAASREVKSFVQTAAPLADRPGALAPAQADLDAAAPALEFDRVDFAYDPARPILRQVSFQIGPGEHVALIGPSGAGKTTIAELIQANLRPDAGTIRCHGLDTAALTADWRRSRLAVVAQRTYLFRGSLRDNLLVARPQAGPEELAQALAAADLDRFVASLPDGLDTPVGERGLALSGGQAQRVGVARAFLADAPILLLDEPTSQVDLESEAVILAALARLTEGRAVLTISHRASTVAGADRVLRLDQGEVEPCPTTL
ncbi:MAG: ABC transporter ATP-binding protein/permease [Propionibacteriaceae bacterium]|jgi:ATP-binding cassette subfamily C protein CydD|nr:ABC transporter ATP-binding protein/permease [Propionibacteriaceae bacterium]